MQKFEIGKKYKTHSHLEIYDNLNVEILSKTDKTITFDFEGKVQTRKISKNHPNYESFRNAPFWVNADNNVTYNNYIN